MELNNLGAIDMVIGNRPYGFKDKDQAMETVDIENPNIGEQYLISGGLYTLEIINGKLEFLRIAE